MKRRVSIVKLINHRAESGIRVGQVNIWAQGFFHMCMVLRKFINEGFIECCIKRALEDKFPDDWEADVRQPQEDIVIFGDLLPYGLTPQLAGALGWVGFGNCNSLCRREWDQLRALGGFWEREVLDATIQL
jgi:hypothetical protein